MRSRRPRAAARAAAAVLIGIAAGLSPGATGGEASAMIEPVLRANYENGRLAYGVVVYAPDACYRLAPGAGVERADGRVTVRREIVREPGLCAAVMTPVEVSGEVIGLSARPEALRLVVTLGERTAFDDTVTP